MKKFEKNGENIKDLRHEKRFSHLLGFESLVSL